MIMKLVKCSSASTVFEEKEVVTIFDGAISKVIEGVACEILSMK